MWHPVSNTIPVRKKYIAILLDEHKKPELGFVYNVEGKYEGPPNKTIFCVSDEDCSIFDALDADIIQTFELM